MKVMKIEVIETVGELIAELQKWPPETPVLLEEGEITDGIVLSRGADDECILEAYYG